MLPSNEELRRREAALMGDVGKINSYLAHSSIPEASRAALQRQRQQEAAKIAADNNSSDMDRLLLVEGLRNRGSGGAFEGKGLTAQALRIWNNPDIPQDAPEKKQAYAILSRPEIINTPEGQVMRPGILGGQTTFTPKKASEGEKKGQYTTENMETLSGRSTGYVPKLTESVAADIPYVGGLMTSKEFKAADAIADEWARNLVFMRSGATARDDEVAAAVKNYWPVYGDEPADVARKEKMRAEAEASARKAFDKREGTERPGDKYLR